MIKISLKSKNLKLAIRDNFIFSIEGQSGI